MNELKMRRISKKERHLAEIMYWVPTDILVSGFQPRTGIACTFRVGTVSENGEPTEEYKLRKHSFLFASVTAPNHLNDAVEHEVEIGSQRRVIRIATQFYAEFSWIKKNLVLMKHPTLPFEQPDEALAWLEPIFEKNEAGKTIIRIREFVPYVRPKPRTRWGILRR